MPRWQSRMGHLHNACPKALVHKSNQGQTGGAGVALPDALRDRRPALRHAVDHTTSDAGFGLLSCQSASTQRRPIRVL